MFIGAVKCRKRIGAKECKPEPEEKETVLDLRKPTPELAQLPKWFNLLTSQKEIDKAKDDIVELLEAAERCRVHIKRFVSKDSKCPKDVAVIAEHEALIYASEEIMRCSNYSEFLSRLSDRIVQVVRGINSRTQDTISWIGSNAVFSMIIHTVRKPFPERLRKV